jgi:hypothetical protein
MNFLSQKEINQSLQVLIGIQNTNHEVLSIQMTKTVHGTLMKEGRVTENVVHFSDLEKKLEESLHKRNWKRILFRELNRVEGK